MDTLLDPETLKRACGIAAAVYFIGAIALFIYAVVTPALRRDASRVVAALLAIIALSLALIDYEFPRASEAVLPILYPGVVFALAVSGLALAALAFRSLKNRTIRIAAIVAAPLPLAVSGVLILISYLLAHSRFCC
jgi:lysylphosphatidylglycerol synthetase-like protein (DUF2156 family)